MYLILREILRGEINPLASLLSDGVKGQITFGEYFCRTLRFDQKHLHLSFLGLTRRSSSGELYFVSSLGFFCSSVSALRGSTQRNQFLSAPLPLEENFGIHKYSHAAISDAQLRDRSSGWAARCLIIGPVYTRLTGSLLPLHTHFHTTLFSHLIPSLLWAFPAAHHQVSFIYCDVPSLVLLSWIVFVCPFRPSFVFLSSSMISLHFVGGFLNLLLTFLFFYFLAKFFSSLIPFLQQFLILLYLCTYF